MTIEHVKALKAHRLRRQKRLGEREKKDTRLNESREKKMNKMRGKYEEKHSKLLGDERKEKNQLQDAWNDEDEEDEVKRAIEDQEDLQIYLAELQNIAEKSSQSIPAENEQDVAIQSKEERIPSTPIHDKGSKDNDAIKSCPPPATPGSACKDYEVPSSAEPMPARSLFEQRRAANMAANKAILGDISPVAVTPTKRARGDRNRTPRTPTTVRVSFSRGAKDAALTNIRKASEQVFEKEQDDNDDLFMVQAKRRKMSPGPPASTHQERGTRYTDP